MRQHLNSKLQNHLRALWYNLIILYSYLMVACTSTEEALQFIRAPRRRINSGDSSRNHVFSIEYFLKWDHIHCVKCKNAKIHSQQRCYTLVTEYAEIAENTALVLTRSSQLMLQVSSTSAESWVEWADEPFTSCVELCCCSFCSDEDSSPLVSPLTGIELSTCSLSSARCVRCSFCTDVCLFNCASRNRVLLADAGRRGFRHTRILRSFQWKVAQ